MEEKRGEGLGGKEGKGREREERKRERGGEGLRGKEREGREREERERERERERGEMAKNREPQNDIV